MKYLKPIIEIQHICSLEVLAMSLSGDTETPSEEPRRSLEMLETDGDEISWEE